MISTEQAKKFEEQLEAKSCVNCAKIEVCHYYRGLQLLIKQQATEKTVPFKPEKLAEICNYYLNRSFLKLLERNQT